jgi:hypothetical protein
MSPECKRPVGNWLLDALPNEAYERLAADLRHVSVVPGDLLYESARRIDDIYSQQVFASLCYPPWLMGAQLGWG